MTKELLIWLLIVGILVSYLIVTTRYYAMFRKNTIFTGKIRTFHLIMIWLIPFFWISLLKSVTRRTPGSYEIENKSSSEPFSGGDSDASRASNML